MESNINPHILLNLFRGVAKVIEEDWQSAAQSVGLTQAEQHMLWVVSFEKRASISTIAKYGLWDRSTVMQVVKRLKEKKLVYVEKDDRDLRVSYVQMTDEGKSRWEETKKANYGFLIFANQLAKEEPDKFASFLEVLEKINKKYYGDDFLQWVSKLEFKE